MAVFTYNGVTLPYPFHTDWRQEFVLDDTGQTDLVYSRYDITVQSIIEQDYLPVLAPEVNTAASNPADIMAYVRQKLKKPRKTLAVTFNGLNLLSTAVQGNAGTVDAKNGPIVQFCNVINLTNTSFLITLRIVAHFWENPTLTPNGVVLVGNNQAGDSILYNRWTETQEIDKFLVSTWTREGKYVIRSDNVDGQIADWYRSKMCTLAVLANCNRESSRYTVSPDGLGISYTITDKQFYRPLPFPAYEAVGEYLETGDIGPRRVIEARVTLKGSTRGGQAQLVSVAMLLARAKVAKRAVALGALGGPVTRDIAISSGFWENKVSCNYKGQVMATKGQLLGKPGDLSLVAVPGITEASPGISLWTDGHPYFPIKGDFDDSFLLQAAAYYDPNLKNHLMNKNTRQLTPTGLQVGQAGKTLET